MVGGRGGGEVLDDGRVQLRAGRDDPGVDVALVGDVQGALFSALIKRARLQQRPQVCRLRRGYVTPRRAS